MGPCNGTFSATVTAFSHGTHPIRLELVADFRKSQSFSSFPPERGHNRVTERAIWTRTEPTQRKAKLYHDDGGIQNV